MQVQEEGEEMIRLLAKLFGIPPCVVKFQGIVYEGDKPHYQLAFYVRRWATDTDIEKWRKEVTRKWEQENDVAVNPEPYDVTRTML